MNAPKTNPAPALVKIFVGGFPLDMTELELVQLVSLHGNVSTIKIVRDKKTGVCKGYAFLEMKNREEAKKVVAALNGEPLGDRTLSVKINIDNAAAAAAKKPGHRPATKPAYIKVSGPSDGLRDKRQRK